MEGGGIRDWRKKKRIMNELKNVINNIIILCKDEQEIYREYLEIESYINRGEQYSEEATLRFTDVRLKLTDIRIEKSQKMNDMTQYLNDMLVRSNALNLKDSILENINRQLHVCENARQGELIEVKERIIHESKNIVEQCRADKEVLEVDLENMEGQIDVLLETNKIINSDCGVSDIYIDIKKKYDALIGKLNGINTIVLEMNSNCNNSKFCRGNIARNMDKLMQNLNDIPEINVVENNIGAKQFKRKSKKNMSGRKFHQRRKSLKRKSSGKKLSRRR